MSNKGKKGKVFCFECGCDLECDLNSEKCRILCDDCNKKLPNTCTYCDKNKRLDGDLFCEKCNEEVKEGTDF